MAGLADVQGYANALITAHAEDPVQLVGILRDLETESSDLRQAVLLELARTANRLLQIVAELTGEEEGDLRKEMLLAETSSADAVDEALRTHRRSEPDAD